jgi:hypothetical protein
MKQLFNGEMPNIKRLLFSELIVFLVWNKLIYIIRKHDSGKYVKYFTC